MMNYAVKMRSLTIKLISPKMSLRPMDSEMKRRMSPPLSLITIASLTPKQHYVYIEDENLRDINFDDCPDLVGINVNVDTSKRAGDIADKYRKKGVKVIFGGIHASANPQELLKYSDSVCIGEAEEVWEEILSDCANGNLKKIYNNTEITDLSKFPYPNWDYVDVRKYLYNNIMIASRGCPFKCDFCYNSSDYIANPYRNRPIENIINEIDSLNTKQVMFIDDNFIGNINWVKEFLSQLKSKKIIWHSAVSTNLVYHEDLIELMAESGCKSLFIGFETINENSLKSVRKKHNKIENYEKLISKLHNYGIMLNASMVFGFDYDTTTVFANTLDWLVSNKIETMTAHILTPYPGTKFHDKLLSENRIFDFNHTHYNTSNVVFYPKNMDADELKQGYLWIYDQFYSLKNIIKRKPENNNILAPYFLFNFGYRKYGRLTASFGKLGLMHWIGKICRKLSYGID